jgi:putative endonuclease
VTEVVCVNAKNAKKTRNAGAPGAGVGNARSALGRYGEELAARRLTAAGMTVLARNWRCREGEIDIVARDGDAVVFCEVKARTGNSYEDPMAAVGPRKADRLRRLAERWLADHGGPPSGGVRIDLVGVVLPERGAARVEHVRGVA